MIPSNHSRRPPQKAFTLIEMIAVMAVIGLVAVITLPAVAKRILDMKMTAEDNVLQTLRQDVIQSSESPNPALNVAAFDYMGVASTVWSPTPNMAGYTSTDANAWFAKISAFRGVTPGAAAPAAQPFVAKILANEFGRARLLVAGPTDEPNAQRFVLVSIMAREEQLYFPAFDGTQGFFEALYSGKDWNTRGGSMPAAIANLMTPAQLQNWMQGGGRGNNFWKMRVVTFSIPKYVVNVSNTHPTARAWIKYNFDNAVLASEPDSGVTISPPILAGQVVKVMRGDITTENNRFTLRENADLIVQKAN